MADGQLSPVGFEPTQLAPVELESTPLDHSGKVYIQALAALPVQYVACEWISPFGPHCALVVHDYAPDYHNFRVSLTLDV